MVRLALRTLILILMLFFMGFGHFAFANNGPTETQVEGQIHFYDENGELAERTPSKDDLEKTLFYVLRKLQDRHSLPEGYTRRPTVSKDHDEGLGRDVLEYSFRLTEDQDYVLVIVKLQRVDYEGLAAERMEKHRGLLPLHLTANKRFESIALAYEAVLKKINTGTLEKLEEAFKLLIDLNRQIPDRKYLSDIALVMNLYGQQGNPPPQSFIRFLRDLNYEARLEALTVEEKKLVYREVMHVLATAYDPRLPIGGGKILYDLIQSVFDDFYKTFSEPSQLLAVSFQEVISRECAIDGYAEDCLLRAESYFRTFHAPPRKDVAGALTTLATTLEKESGVGVVNDVTEAKRVERLRQNTRLKRLWTRFHCIVEEHNLLGGFVEYMANDTKVYLKKVINMAKEIRGGTKCDLGV